MKYFYTNTNLQYYQSDWSQIDPISVQTHQMWLGNSLLYSVHVT